MIDYDGMPIKEINPEALENDSQVSNKKEDQNQILLELREQIGKQEELLKKFEGKGLNQTLLDLRIAVMRTISEVWRSESGTDNQGDENAILANLAHNHDQLLSLCDVNEESDKHYMASSFTTIEEFNEELGTLLKKNKGSLKEKFKKLDSAFKLVDFRRFIESCNPQNLKLLWSILFDLNIHYPFFGVQIIKPTARWNSYGDNQWTKPDTEALYVSLPNLPNGTLVPIEDPLSFLFGGNQRSDDKKEYAKASYLTKYYQSFPSFLGTSYGEPKSKPHESSDGNGAVGDFLKIESDPDYPRRNKTLRLKERDFDELQVDPHGSNYDLGIAADQFQGFSSMITKLLAVMWKHNDFRKRIDYAKRLINETSVLNEHQSWKKTTDKKGTIKSCTFKSLFEFSKYLNTRKGDVADELAKFNSEYAQEMDALLSKYFHYESPWIFHLRIIVPTEKVFFEKEEQENVWQYMPDPQHVLNLTTIEIPHLPTKEEGTNNVSLALARYNATGPAYPFTCS